MADEPQVDHPTVIRAINWREVFPFTNIFRAFRVAVHPSKLVLGLVALLLLYAGGRILDGVWAQDHKANFGESADYEKHKGDVPFSTAIAAERAENRQAYAGVIAALDARDAGLKQAADARDAALKAAGSDAAKQQAANKAFDDAEAMVLAPFDAAGRPPVAPVTEAAKTFEGQNEVKHRLVAGRDRRLALIERQYVVAKAAADGIADAVQKDKAQRDAETTRVAARAATFASAKANLETVHQIVPRGLFDEFLDYQVKQVNHIADASLSLSWGGIVSGVTNFFAVGPAWLFRFHPLFATLFFVLFLGVWAVFGGAIARIAAVQVARDEKISVRQALRFSVNKVLSFVFAPVIPLVIVLAIGLVLAVGGLLYYIPWIGPIAAGALFFLALIAGVVATLVLLGTAGGLSLMFPTIAVEGSDSFDAISRSFSYVFARPWRMIFYTLVAVVYGGLTYLFVRLFTFVVLAVTHAFIGWFLGGQAATWYPEIWPTPTFAQLPYDVNFAGLAWSEDIAAFLICLWVYLVLGLLGSFVISFYFSANTVIYYLMRREVDATELDDVYIEEADDDFVEPAAIEAVPATGNPVAPVTATPVDPVVPPSSEPNPT